MGRRAEERLGTSWTSLVARRSSWLRALLAASILSSGFLQPQALDVDVTVEPAPTLLEGQNATLTPGGSADFVLCGWYRGEDAEENLIFTYHPPPYLFQQVGPRFSGQETAGPGCSLHIWSVALNNSGTYVMSKLVMGGDIETGRVHIEVPEKLSPPTLWPAESTVKEHANATLNCTTSESSTVTVSWLKDGKPVPAKSVMFNRNRILVVPDVRKGDQGTYTCVARNPASKATSNPSEIVLESTLAQRVKVQHEVMGHLGDQVVLPCTFTSTSPDIKVSQVTWVKETEGTKRQKVAVYHPEHGPRYLMERGSGRIRFRTQSLQDATLIIGPLRMSDEGTYTCEFATYPLGNEDGLTNLIVLAKPNNSAEPQEVKVGNTAMSVATCTSANGKPPAYITWQLGLNGNFTVSETPGENGTVTVTSHYMMVPTKEANLQRIFCHIDQKALPQPVSLPVTLSISFAGSPSTSQVGAISGIVLGCLAVAALAGTLLYRFSRARCAKDKMNRMSPVYENRRPSAQVRLENSSGDNHTYEVLQRGQQSVYDQLKW